MLLRQYAVVLDALAEAEAIRSKNNPVADYAEWLVARAFRFELMTKSSKGYDTIASDGIKYTI